MTALRSATELSVAASKPYPKDSAGYREARVALLAEEIELRRHIERVAAQRRALPPGGEQRNYQFNDDAGKTVGLTDLFGVHDTLVTYFLDVPPRTRVAVSDVHLVPGPSTFPFAISRNASPLR